MNILIIYEYNLISANNIISEKLINELLAHGENVSKFYFYNEFDSIDKIFEDSVWNYTVQSSKTRAYLFTKRNSHWQHKSFIRKLIYVISHPKVLFSFVSYKTDYLSKFKNGRKKLKLFCANNHMDCIIGISAPHDIEKIISKLDIDIPRYLIRFDPYAFNPCSESSFKKRIKEEKRILNEVDKMFTTKHIISDLLTENSIKEYANKMIPIEFPFISDNNEHEINSSESKGIITRIDQCVYMLHAGSFYEDIRNPKKLVDFIKELPENYVLLVAGSNSYSIRDYDSAIRDRVIDLGSLSREAVKKVIEECDFLISYNNLNTNMVPSKLFECIDSGKPFINLCHTDKCPTIEYVKDYDMAYTVIADQPLPKNDLISFFERTKGCRSSREQILTKYRKCTVKYVAEQILNEMNPR